jgi:Family of unknown function (DUF5677)
MTESELRAEARAIGEEFLHVSEHYEGGTLPKTGGLFVLAIAAIVARSRRMLIAIHHLTEVGCDLEAGIILRSLNEYAITARWLCGNRLANHAIWAWDDIRRRIEMDRELGRLGVEDRIAPDVMARYETSRAEYAEIYRQATGQKATSRSLPSVLERAKCVNMVVEYGLAYRYDSNAGVHPSALALQRIVVEHADEYELRSEVPVQAGDVAPEAVAAALFAHVLIAGAEVDTRLQDAVSPLIARLADLRELRTPGE